MQGHFSDNALALYAELLRDLENPDFSEEGSESYDFTRCVRANGTVYGTGGKCRKGKEVAPDKKAKQADMRARMAAAASRLEGAAPVPKATEPKKETKAERRARVLKELKAHQNTKPEHLSNNILTLARLIKSEPKFKTPLTVSTLVALRALRMKAYLDSKKAHAETETQSKVPASAKQRESDLIKQSPKYRQTPGSSEPLPKPTKVRVLKELDEELKSRKIELERETDPRNRNNIEYNITRIESEISYVTRRGVSDLVPPDLRKVYEKQGYNAKPEVVAKRSDLEARSDIARNPDGRPIIAYRGVTTEEFSTQFKGGGPNGEVHFPGNGIYGNGSYAASSPLTGEVKHDTWAQETAVTYTGARFGRSPLVTAFAFRSDAKLVQFEGDGKSFAEWEMGVLREAKKTTDYDFTDAGAAAAALGIHAYRVPQMGQDYWVVLNRGAIIVAEDPELPKDLQ